MKSRWSIALLAAAVAPALLGCETGMRVVITD
jgi:hypothetical protein